jgi:His-Xaa-Ser system protein HxsD
MTEFKTEDYLLKFPKAAYSSEAILNAAYDFSDRAWIKIKEITAENILVQIEIKDFQKIPLEIIIKDFQNQANDHQIRINLAKDTHLIREMIVAQAFDPCDNLDEILSAYERES